MAEPGWRAVTCWSARRACVPRPRVRVVRHYAVRHDAHKCVGDEQCHPMAVRMEHVLLGYCDQLHTAGRHDAVPWRKIGCVCLAHTTAISATEFRTASNA